MFRTYEVHRGFPISCWPRDGCEQTAIAIAGVLEDRGLGRWTYVTAGRPGEVNGHAWLEWLDGDGTVLFSIDPTLHQFAEWEEPFVGEGATPAASSFTQRRYVGSPWGWPFLGTESEVFRRLLRAVRDDLEQPG